MKWEMEQLKRQALGGDGTSFYFLFEKAFYGEVEAVEAFHQVVMSHPSCFYRFSQFFFHPQFREVAFQVARHPRFDLALLEPWVATNPPLLVILGGLALEADHPTAREILPRLEFDRKIYQEAVEKNGDYIPLLSLIAESGCTNVQDLLNQLVSEASPELFFAFVGVAVEGSPAALRALNLGSTPSQIMSLTQFVWKYEDHAIFRSSLCSLVSKISHNAALPTLH